MTDTPPIVKKRRHNWFAAHVIVYGLFDDDDNVEDSDWFPCYENIILVEAATVEEAQKKCEEVGQSYESSDELGDTWDGRTVHWHFGGVRKVVECLEADQRPKDKSELTYSLMEVEGEEDLHRLIMGESVPVNLIE